MWDLNLIMSSTNPLSLEKSITLGDSQCYLYRIHDIHFYAESDQSKKVIENVFKALNQSKSKYVKTIWQLSQQGIAQQQITIIAIDNDFATRRASFLPLLSGETTVVLRTDGSIKQLKATLLHELSHSHPLGQLVLPITFNANDLLCLDKRHLAHLPIKLKSQAESLLNGLNQATLSVASQDFLAGKKLSLAQQQVCEYLFKRPFLPHYVDKNHSLAEIFTHGAEIREIHPQVFKQIAPELDRFYESIAKDLQQEFFIPHHADNKTFFSKQSAEFNFQANQNKGAVQTKIHQYTVIKPPVTPPQFASELSYNSSVGVIKKVGKTIALEIFLEQMKTYHINSFASGTVHIGQLTAPLTVYRTGGNGKYWSLTPPKSPWQHSIEMAMHPDLYPSQMKTVANWHPSNKGVIEYTIPKDTIIARGRAASQFGFCGMGEQIFMPAPQNTSIKVMPWPEYFNSTPKNTPPSSHDWPTAIKVNEVLLQRGLPKGRIIEGKLIPPHVENIAFGLNGERVTSIRHWRSELGKTIPKVSKWQLSRHVKVKIASWALDGLFIAADLIHERLINPDSSWCDSLLKVSMNHLPSLLINLSVLPVFGFPAAFVTTMVFQHMLQNAIRDPKLQYNYALLMTENRQTKQLCHRMSSKPWTLSNSEQNEIRKDFFSLHVGTMKAVVPGYDTTRFKIIHDEVQIKSALDAIHNAPETQQLIAQINALSVSDRMSLNGNASKLVEKLASRTQQLTEETLVSLTNSNNAQGYLENERQTVLEQTNSRDVPQYKTHNLTGKSLPTLGYQSPFADIQQALDFPLSPSQLTCPISDNGAKTALQTFELPKSSQEPRKKFQAATLTDKEKQEISLHTRQRHQLPAGVGSGALPGISVATMPVSVPGINSAVSVGVQIESQVAYDVIDTLTNAKICDDYVTYYGDEYRYKVYYKGWFNAIVKIYDREGNKLLTKDIHIPKAIWGLPARDINKRVGKGVKLALKEAIPAFITANINKTIASCNNAIINNPVSCLQEVAVTAAALQKYSEFPEVCDILKSLMQNAVNASTSVLEKSPLVTHDQQVIPPATDVSLYHYDNYSFSLPNKAKRGGNTRHDVTRFNERLKITLDNQSIHTLSVAQLDYLIALGYEFYHNWSKWENDKQTTKEREDNYTALKETLNTLETLRTDVKFTQEMLANHTLAGLIGEYIRLNKTNVNPLICQSLQHHIQLDIARVMASGDREQIEPVMCLLGNSNIVQEAQFLKDYQLFLPLSFEDFCGDFFIQPIFAKLIEKASHSDSTLLMNFYTALLDNKDKGTELNPDGGDINKNLLSLYQKWCKNEIDNQEALNYLDKIAQKDYPAILNLATSGSKNEIDNQEALSYLDKIEQKDYPAILNLATSGSKDESLTNSQAKPLFLMAVIMETFVQENILMNPDSNDGQKDKAYNTLKTLALFINDCDMKNYVSSQLRIKDDTPGNTEQDTNSVSIEVQSKEWAQVFLKSDALCDGKWQIKTYLTELISGTTFLNQDELSHEEKDALLKKYYQAAKNLIDSSFSDTGEDSEASKIDNEQDGENLSIRQQQTQIRASCQLFIEQYDRVDGNSQLFLEMSALLEAVQDEDANKSYMKAKEIIKNYDNKKTKEVCEKVIAGQYEKLTIYVFSPATQIMLYMLDNYANDYGGKWAQKSSHFLHYSHNLFPTVIPELQCAPYAWWRGDMPSWKINFFTKIKNQLNKYSKNPFGSLNRFSRAANVMTILASFPLLMMEEGEFKASYSQNLSYAINGTHALTTTTMLVKTCKYIYQRKSLMKCAPAWAGLAVDSLCGVYDFANTDLLLPQKLGDHTALDQLRLHGAYLVGNNPGHLTEYGSVLAGRDLVKVTLSLALIGIYGLNPVTAPFAVIQAALMMVNIGSGGYSKMAAQNSLQNISYFLRVNNFDQVAAHSESLAQNINICGDYSQIINADSTVNEYRNTDKEVIKQAKCFLQYIYCLQALQQKQYATIRALSKHETNGGSEILSNSKCPIKDTHHVMLLRLQAMIEDYEGYFKDNWQNVYDEYNFLYDFYDNGNQPQRDMITNLFSDIGYAIRIQHLRLLTEQCDSEKKSIPQAGIDAYDHQETKGLVLATVYVKGENAMKNQLVCAKARFDAHIRVVQRDYTQARVLTTHQGENELTLFSHANIPFFKAQGLIITRLQSIIYDYSYFSKNIHSVYHEFVQFVNLISALNVCDAWRDDSLKILKAIGFSLREQHARFVLEESKKGVKYYKNARCDLILHHLTLCPDEGNSESRFNYYLGLSQIQIGKPLSYIKYFKKISSEFRTVEHWQPLIHILAESRQTLLSNVAHFQILSLEKCCLEMMKYCYLEIDDLFKNKGITETSLSEKEQEEYEQIQRHLELMHDIDAMSLDESRIEKINFFYHKITTQYLGKSNDDLWQKYQELENDNASFFKSLKNKQCSKESLYEDNEKLWKQLLGSCQ